MAKTAIASALEFITTITTRVMAGLSKQDEEAILSLSEDALKHLADDFRKKLLHAAVAGNILNVVVDYSLSFAQMIAAGVYDSANGDITAKHFPITETGVRAVAIELLHCGRYVTSDEVLKNLEAKGMRPATLPELLAIGATYPEKQREFPIIALGSVWQRPDGVCYVTRIGRWRDRRKLFLFWFNREWTPMCRFAAVRK